MATQSKERFEPQHLIPMRKAPAPVPNLYTRRDIISAAMATAASTATGNMDQRLNRSGDGIAAGEVDIPALVSRADLHYHHPAARPMDGMPIGNGRMGSMVWTTPTAMHFQINRPDVFAQCGRTNSFPQRNTDYSGGCAYVDIRTVVYGEPVFSGPAFHQHLSCHDAVMTLNGAGVTARLLAWHRRDVLAVEITDSRPVPQAISIDLRMLRYLRQYHSGHNYALARSHTVEIRHRSQIASSTLSISAGRIALMQQFREDSFYCTSAVTVAVKGRKAQARYVNESTVQLTVEPAAGSFVVLIASCASFDAKEDIAASAMDNLAAVPENFPDLLADNRKWWHHFWSRGYVQLHSSDGQAQFVERNYTYYLYLMASSSRGAYPPRFGGMLWNTDGDMREWGSEYWWSNMACYYDGLQPANRLELMDPIFAMYTGMFDNCRRAARQQWNSKGIYIQETTFFDGPAPLPTAIADEMASLYLGARPWKTVSRRFMKFAAAKLPHESRWNWKGFGKWVQGRWVWKPRPQAPYGPVVHFFSSQIKIAYLYYLQYEYSQDLVFLRKQAYPMLKSVAEFFRNFPNFKLGADGKYHLYKANDSEGVQGGTDPQDTMAGLHALFQIVARTADVLGLDSELRVIWRRIAEKLAPLPTRSLLPDYRGDPDYFVAALPPVAFGNPSHPDLTAVMDFGLCSPSIDNARRMTLAENTYRVFFRDGVGPDTPVSVMSGVARAAAHLGRGEDLKFLLPNQIRCLEPTHDFCDIRGSADHGPLANRLTLREGPGDPGAERLGRVTAALHDALLQCASPAPGAEPVIHLFPAWPKNWNADFKLLARGGFVVQAGIRDGTIRPVHIASQYGGICRVKNPWPGKSVRLVHSVHGKSSHSDSVLSIYLAKGQTVVISPQ